MIIKFLDHDNQWTWINSINEITKIGYINPGSLDLLEFDASEVEMFGESNGSLPLIVSINTNTSKRLIAINAKQAYICNSESGSTIDILIDGRGKE